MQITEARAGGATTLRIVGRVDGSVSATLEQTVLDAVARTDVVVVDLRDTSYVSSAGLRAFIVFAKRAHARSRTIALCGLNEELNEIFELSGLLELFPIYDTVEAAVAAPPR